MKILAMALGAILLLASPAASAQEQRTDGYYGRIFFFNYTDKPARLTFADKREPIDIPPMMISYIPVRAIVFDFAVDLKGFSLLEKSEYLGKADFAEAKDNRWICMILNVPRGEYYHPEIRKLAAWECAAMVEAR